MPTGTVTKQVVAGGLTLYSQITRTEEASIAEQVTLPAGKAGAISAAGIDGLATGHGILDTDTVDVHWTVAGVQYCRYGIAVDTAATNAITFDDDPAAAGDALPAEDTAVVVSVQVSIDIAFDANNAKLVALHSDQIAHADMQNDDPASMFAVKLAQNSVWFWNEGDNIANPFIGADDDVAAHIIASNGSTTAATMKIVVMYDSVA